MTGRSECPRRCLTCARRSRWPPSSRARGTTSAGERLGWLASDQQLPGRRALWEYLCGMHLLAASRAAAAEPHLAASLRQEPKHWRAAFALGDALARQGKREQAAGFFDGLAQ